ncbi:MAG: antitoxin [Chloroflexi bacterium]|nr:antitoxin [Chloroflexota bacterium]
MIARYRTLARRIQLEVEELERTQAAIQRHWQTAIRTATDQDAYLNSVALNLHSFYSGLERIFELIALELDGGALGGDAWHVELLRQMALDVPEVRPSVLQQDTAARLDEYRKFRHRIRNIYATNLDPDRMAHLVTDLPSLWPQIHRELAAFTTFLRELAGVEGR